MSLRHRFRRNYLWRVAQAFLRHHFTRPAHVRGTISSYTVMLADQKPTFKIKPKSNQDFRMEHTEKLEVAFRTVAITGYPTTDNRSCGTSLDTPTWPNFAIWGSLSAIVSYVYVLRCYYIPSQSSSNPCNIALVARNRQTLLPNVKALHIPAILI